MGREVLGSISDPIKLFSRQPDILKFVHCHRIDEKIGGKNTFDAFIDLRSKFKSWGKATRPELGFHYQELNYVLAVDLILQEWTWLDQKCLEFERW